MPQSEEASFPYLILLSHCPDLGHVLTSHSKASIAKEEGNSSQRLEEKLEDLPGEVGMKVERPPHICQKNKV